MEEAAEQQVAAEAARVVMETILLVWLHFDDRGQQFTGCMISSSSSSLEVIFVFRVCVCVCCFRSRDVCSGPAQQESTVLTRARGF